jgi:hypothetical protein
VAPTVASTAVGVVTVSRSGMASGVNSTFRQVGIATGIAGLGAVFQHDLNKGVATALIAGGHYRHVLVSLHMSVAQLLESGHATEFARVLPPAGRDVLLHAYRVGFTDGLTSILLIASGVAVVGAGCAFALVRDVEVGVSDQVIEMSHAERFVSSSAPGE